jgi:DNA polymerase
MLFAYSVDFGEVVVCDLFQHTLPPDIIQALSDPNVIKHAFNAPFEWYSINKFWYSPIDQWRCTMFHSLYCGFPTSLAAVSASIGLPEDKQKMSIGMALIKTFCVPTKPTNPNGQITRTMPHHAPDKWKLFKEYCKQDVISEMAISKKLINYPVPDIEQEYWVIDQIMNATGIKIDLDLIGGALQCENISTKQLLEEAVALSGLNNPKSVQQLTKWLSTELDTEVTTLRKEDVKKMLKDNVGDDKVKRLLEIRLELAKTSVKKYLAMGSSVCADHRVRGLLQFYGANRTGRWAGRLIQVHNLPKNFIEPLGHARSFIKETNVEAIKIIFGNVPDTLSQAIRTAFIPELGNKFVVADFSAIEARVLSWLAGEKWRMDVFATHGKIYEASASAMFGIPIEKIKKGNTEYSYRQKGKVAELACGYQGGIGALKAMGADEMGLSDEELQGIIDRWRNSNPNIVRFWHDIQRAVIDAIKTGRSSRVGHIGIMVTHDMVNKLTFLHFELPSKRRLFYAYPAIAVNKWGADSIAYLGMDQETKKWKLIETYGGKLVENITQAVSRDCLAHTVHRLHNSGVRVVTHIHDEVICEVPEAVAEDQLHRICGVMREPIPWAQGLILNAEGFVGDYYKKEG